MRRELVVALVVAWCLVAARSAVYLLYPQSFFDSDQAVVGLMAKHLVEGRAFPLFMYGQAYQMAVDAWVAAPFFIALGPTFEALRLSLILWNLAAATALVVGLSRAGLRPSYALAATAFFTCAPPLTAASLLEFAGNVGPLLFVAVLWFLRRRPVWFGVVLALGFLARDFTIYAVPVLALGHVIEGSLLQRERLRWWAMAIAAFLAVWLSITASRSRARRARRSRTSSRGSRSSRPSCPPAPSQWPHTTCRARSGRRPPTRRSPARAATGCSGPWPSRSRSHSSGRWRSAGTSRDSRGICSAWGRWRRPST
jgi:hypothetical protein